MSATNKGILLLASAIFAFTAMDALAKHLVATFPTVQVVWARNIGQLVLVALILRERFGGAMRTAHPKLHLARSCTQLLATGFFFVSLSYIGLAEATALAGISPILITLGAALFLGERLTRARVLALGLAGAGALVILRPGMGVFTLAAILPLLCAAAYAANMLLTRAVGARESPWAAMIYAALFGTVLTSAALPWAWVTPTAMEVALFAAVGVLGALAQLLIIRAYSLAEASVLAPFGYLDMLYAMGWSVFAFGHWPDLPTALGALVIALAGLYVWAEGKRGTA